MLIEITLSSEELIELKILKDPFSSKCTAKDNLIAGLSKISEKLLKK